MSRFKKVRSKAELDNLINTLTKNRKILQDEVTSEVVGKEFAKQGAQEQASPITAELQKVVKKIDDVLNPTQMKNKVTDKPWLGQEPETEYNENTAERKEVSKNLLQGILKAIKKDRPLFKQIVESIEGAPGKEGIKNMLADIQVNTAQIDTVGDEIKNLGTALHNDLYNVTLGVTFISKLLHTEPENVISLLKDNLGESKKLLAVVGNLRASAGPRDPGSPPPGGNSASPTKSNDDDDDSDFDDALDEESATPRKTDKKLPPASSLIKKKDKVPVGIIPSTSTSDIAPNPGNDRINEKEEERQEKRAADQLKALQQISSNVNRDKANIFLNDNSIKTKEDISDVIGGYDNNQILELLTSIVDDKSEDEILGSVLYSPDMRKLYDDDPTSKNEAFQLTANNILRQIMGVDSSKSPKKSNSKKSIKIDESKSQKNKNKEKDEIEKLEKKYQVANSVINNPKSPRKSKEKARKAAEFAKQRLKELGVHGFGIGASVSEKRSYDPYRMDGNGVMGKLQIDKDLLNRLMLRVHKDGQQIAYQPIPYDLVELLTKKYNSRKKYHPDAIELFQKLIRHSDIPFDSVKNNKFKNIISKLHEQEGNGQIWDPLANLVARNAVNSANAKRVSEGRAAVDMPDSFKGDFRQTGNGCGCENHSDDELVRIVDSPEEAFNRLNILLGEVEAGNSAKEITNEIGQLLEYLHKHNHIDDEGYKGLVKACGLSD